MLLSARKCRNFSFSPHSLLLGLCSAVFAGCSTHSRTANPQIVYQLIEARIDAGLDATRSRDIDRYMSLVPQDWTLHDENGATLTRDDLRRGVLEQWSIIDKTISLSEHIDRLELHDSKATVWTSQRWERLMHERKGPALDDVLTTQTHEEHWRFVRGQWWCYEIKELGGEIFVNGKPYHE
jgi:hypothetical protein